MNNMGEKLIVNRSEDAEIISVRLSPDETPIAYENKVRCLMSSGLSREEAVKLGTIRSPYMGDMYELVQSYETDSDQGDVKTLEEFRDLINSSEYWLFRFGEIIHDNGWIDHTGDVYGICEDENGRILEFDSEAKAYIISDANNIK